MVEGNGHRVHPCEMNPAPLPCLNTRATYNISASTLGHSVSTLATLLFCATDHRVKIGDVQLGH